MIEKEKGITFSKIKNMIPKLNEFIEEYRDKIGGKIIFTNLTPWTKEYLPQNIQEDVTIRQELCEHLINFTFLLCMERH